MKIFFGVILAIGLGVTFWLLLLSEKQASIPVVEDVTDEEQETTVPDDVAEHIASKADLIQVTQPQVNETITSPVTVTGQARGYWFFEASFPIVVVDWDGKIIGEGYATADGEWMTEDFVPFTGTITFTVEPDVAYSRGTLIFKRDNPSGLPEHDDALEIPIQLQ